jgi:hypothetical protein
MVILADSLVVFEHLQGPEMKHVLKDYSAFFIFELLHFGQAKVKDVKVPDVHCN